jgi:D-glycero-beta-D-manno-heptose-7-phosphate kinase
MSAPLQSRSSAGARRLIDVVRAFAGRRVAVLADLVADEFVYGDIVRISREAPVPILEHRRTVAVPGGGGNAVANLRALGAVPLPVGVVGADESGRRLLAALRRLRVDLKTVLVVKGYATPTKSRILAGGVHTRRQQIVRVDRGATPGDLAPRLSARLGRLLRQRARGAEGLLVADYGYGVATPGQLAALGRWAPPHVTVDSRARVQAYRRATACTPNQEEVERALDLAPIVEDRALNRAGQRLLERTQNRAVLVTRGARGMSLFERGQRPAHIPAYGSDEVADVTGAGDTVTAAFTLALIAGASLTDAARLANYAAGLVVHKAGTATVSPRELIAAIREDLAA